MVHNFDIDIFCENLRATKPPYECPVETCGKVYKSYTGIHCHMHSHNREPAEYVEVNSTSSMIKATPSLLASAASYDKGGLQNSLPAAGKLGPREVTSSHGMNRIVEVEVGGGRMLKVDVRAPLNIFIRHDEDCGHDVSKDTALSSKGNPTMAKDAGRTRKESTASLSPGMKLPEAQFRVLDNFVKCPNVPQRPTNYYRFTPKTAEEMDKEIDYDMDELV
jgi:bromodomain and PHD finger-containing protein 1